MELISSPIAEALGGNLGGALVKSIDQGTRLSGRDRQRRPWEQILGALLGGAGAPDAAAAAGGMDLGAVISQIAGDGGGALPAAVSVIRNAMLK
ncbi:MAG: hypothetical protein JNK88_11740 [Mangrovicoccus sp.]|nr:hypothetical protein [Mangrovicoccus sp.]